jgi:hypothetical protein
MFKSREIFFKLIVLFILSAITAGVYLLVKDDALSPVARQWLTKLESEQAAGSHAFQYLYGIQSAVDADVEASGRRRFIAYSQAEQRFSSLSENFAFDDPIKPDALKLPPINETLYCNLHSDSCLNSLYQHKSEWQQEIENQSVLLLRYQRYLRFDDFTTLTRPTAYELLPDYKVLMQGNRLFILKLLLTKESGNPGQMLDMLDADMVGLRKQLERADTWVYKMVFVQLVANDLDILAFIAEHSAAEISIQILPLTKAEMSTERANLHEFAMTYNMAQQLDGNPEIFEQGGKLPSWLVNLVYKPNKSVNQQIPYFQQQINWSKLSAAEFAAIDISHTDDTSNDVDYFNFVGSILNSIARPAMHVYLARLFDLDCKIALVNYLLSGKRKPLINPYYPDATRLQQTQTQLCLDGPYQDDRFFRCVKIRSQPAR